MKAGQHGTNTLKETVMKKIIALAVLSIVMVSCYEDYLVDYPVTAVYFPWQQDVRTFVVGEGMKFEVGASLSGVRDNTFDRNVSFALNQALITPAQLVKMQKAAQDYIKNATADVAALELLPTTHYSMTPSNSSFVIKQGWYMGSVVIKADSARFLADSAKTTRMSTYVLPFYITAADADTILESQRFNVVGTMYENMLFGNYWHGGSARVVREGKADSIVKYYTKIPSQNNLAWTLTTIGPTTLSCNGYFNAVASAGGSQMKLVLKGTKVFVSSIEGSAKTIEPDGECIFNRPKLLQDRRIYLKYKFTDPGTGYVYHCTDTLRFRNRVRDGVNEWQDENPSHYGK